MSLLPGYGAELGECVDVCVRWGWMQLGPSWDMSPWPWNHALQGFQTTGRVPEIRHLSPVTTVFAISLRQWGLLGDNWGGSQRHLYSTFPSLLTHPPPPHHPPLHSTGPILHAWHWSVLQNHNRASRSTPQLTQTICRDGFWHCWQLVKPRTTPASTFPPLYPNWQAVFLFCNAKKGFALCFSGIWACTWAKTCTTHIGGQECRFPSTTILRKEHRNALKIEVRLNAITNLIQQFI